MSKKYRRRPCPLCAREFGRLDKHTCPEQPAIVDWLARTLPDDTRPGYILTLIEYESIPNKPLCAPALKEHYGFWAALARRYSLKCPPAKGSAERVRAKSDAALLPEEIAELRRLADVLHAGQFGPSSSEYDLYMQNLNVTRSGLAYRFAGGSWGDVLAAAGLRAGTHSEYARAAVARKKARGIQLVNRDTPSRKRYTYERGDDPIPRDYMGIAVANHNRIDGQRRHTAGYTWTVI